MSLHKLNVMLLVLLLGCLVLNWWVRRDFSSPNAEFLPDMAHGPAYGAFAANTNFADGKTLQTPVPGTLPRGRRVMHYQPMPQDAVRAGDELRSPLAFELSDAGLRGATVFASFCQHCHGAEGLGDGPVTRRGFPPPPSLLAPHALEMKDGQMFHVVTYGQGNMPAHAAQLDVEDRWRVIAHVRELQHRAAVAGVASGPAATSQPATTSSPKGARP